MVVQQFTELCDLLKLWTPPWKCKHFVILFIIITSDLYAKHREEKLLYIRSYFSYIYICWNLYQCVFTNVLGATSHAGGGGEDDRPHSSSCHEPHQVRFPVEYSFQV